MINASLYDTATARSEQRKQAMASGKSSSRAKGIINGGTPLKCR